MRVKTIYLEITNRCNLNCRTCYNRSGLNRKTEEMSVDQIRQCIDFFCLLGLQRVLLAGGEPALHSQFNNILALIDEYPALSFGVVTNGTQCCQTLIDTFHRTDRLTIQISLDGSNEVLNAKTRGKGHFDNAVRFAQALKGAPQKPLLKSVLSQHNIHDVEPYYKLAISLGCIPEFAFIYRCGNGEDEWDSKALTSDQKLHAIRQICRLNAIHKVDAFLPLCTYGCPFSSSNTEELSLCIKTDGSIQPCQSLYDKRFCIGNAFLPNSKSIENAMNDIIAIAKARRMQDYHCQKCILKSSCLKGCIASAFFLHSDPLADDGDCDFRKKQFITFHLQTNAPTLSKETTP